MRIESLTVALRPRTAWEAVEPAKGVKPDMSSGGWRILAKRGRDGKASK